MFLKQTNKNNRLMRFNRGQEGSKRVPNTEKNLYGGCQRKKTNEGEEGEIAENVQV